MSTARDLLFVTLDVPGDHPVEQGDLSLALAGAELLDLLAGGAVLLIGDRLRPGPRVLTGDPLLDEAAARIQGEEPYESVEDWLWRRGRGLAEGYTAVLEAEGQLSTVRRHRWLPSRPVDRTTPADGSADRRSAADRWAAREPVLTALAATLGVTPDTGDGAPAAEPEDETALTVLAAVGDAVTELEGVRQRRRVENAAFDNIWRAP
ncbi:GPP34 family phosphoprotein [Streptomyces sp. NPDC004042]|uniref:GOLPH3/VPS74 family protein n=1 Tax=Streptomyces sp. NPDC004042 TaxID=3154451 RepID=UPI0033A0113C